MKKLYKALVLLIATHAYYLTGNTQITVASHEFGFEFDAQRSESQEATLYNINNCKGCWIKLHLRDNGIIINFAIFDKGGWVKLRGKLIAGRDTLMRYRVVKQVDSSDKKIHSYIVTVKYLELIDTGTWTYYDKQRNVTKKLEFAYEYLW